MGMRVDGLMTRVKKFESEQEMLDLIHNGRDLYCPELGLYCFEYNDRGAICSYDIDVYEAFDLMFAAFENNEYWAAFLGPGGEIWDSPDDEVFKPAEGCSNVDFCHRYFRRDWIDVTVPSLMKE